MTDYTLLDWAPQPAAGTLLTLSEVLLPMLWWRGITLHRLAPVRATPLERFTVELALSVGRADPDEFFEITGLPATLLPVAARRLVNTGALRPSGEGFAVVREVATRVTATNNVHERRPEPFDLVLLPRTGDLVALRPQSSWLRSADQARLRPVGQAPVPAELRGRPLTTLVDQRLAGTGQAGSRGIPGLGPDVVGAAPQLGAPTVIAPDGWCPVYRASAVLRHDEQSEPMPVLTLDGGTSKRTVTAELPGATGLARRWLAAVDGLNDPATRGRLWAEVTRATATPPAAERVDTARWRYRIDGTDAHQLAERPRNLAVPLGVGVRVDDFIAVVTIELDAADRAAADAIGLDRALSAAAAPGAEVAQVPAGATARDRAWRLGFHSLVYALREREDFGYA